MAGHSKWANIKHRKGEQDRKRAKIFNRISKEIIVAVRDGGPDPEDNPPLRTAIQNAKGANMPKDRIERAIKKGNGDDQESQQLQYASYEGYASGGVGVYIEALTDNINRTVADIRSILTKHGGNLAKNGSLAPLFDKKGVFSIAKESMGDMDKDSFEMELIDGGAEEVVQQEEHFIVYTGFKDFGPMRDKLEEMGIESKSAKVEHVPISNQPLELEDANKVLRVVDKLEDLDDVDAVYHNLELTEELQAELENS